MALMDSTSPASGNMPHAGIPIAAMNMKEAFTWYSLPPALIRPQPPTERGSSRLLVPVPGQVQDTASKPLKDLCAHIRDVLSSSEPFADLVFNTGIEKLLPPCAHLVLNQSKVVQARVWSCGIISCNGARNDSIRREIMFLSPEQTQGKVAMNAILSSDALGSTWKVMVRAQKMLVKGVLDATSSPPLVDAGDHLLLERGKNECIRVKILKALSTWQEENEFDGQEVVAQVVDTRDGSVTIGKRISMIEFFDHHGVMPIPPYFDRESTEKDCEDYQILFGDRHSQVGSVAAATAGLHFTPDVLERVQRNGDRVVSFINLHVGAGTFMPVTEEDLRNHDMHEEEFLVTTSLIQDLITSLKVMRPILAVGTTSMRTLETLYWLGARAILQGLGHDRGCCFEPAQLGQWDSYLITQRFLSAGGSLPCGQDALGKLLEQNGHSEYLHGSTKLLIAPGYTFSGIIDGLLTNFHQEDSTLLLLVQAFLDDKNGGGPSKLQNLYEYAIGRQYSFLSFGDCCLLCRGT